jgi:hypothetical protein
MSTVDAFLTALQRNLFTKLVLPTEVEFSLLDTFDVVDSQWRQAAKSGGSPDGRDGGFKCYASWIDAHNATVAFEVAKAVEYRKRRSDLEAIADNSKSLEEIMTRMIDQNLDKDSVSHMDEEEDESTSYSARGSIQDRSHDDESDDLRI